MIAVVSRNAASCLNLELIFGLEFEGVTKNFWQWYLTTFVCAAFAFAFFATANAAGQDTPVSPRLVICGGGSLPKSIFEQFRRLAGPKPKLVVIPTASRYEFDVVESQKLWIARGFEDVHVLHDRDRDLASSPDFVAPLRTATAVWFGGGLQQRIADAYLDTLVEKELHRLLQRGGVIGGTSAGAAVQSRVMIASGKSEPRISTGFDLLRGAIVDQHFLKRNRIPRLMAAVQANPELVGVGIDEGTALIIEDGQATVLGESYVLRIESRRGNIYLDAFDNGETLPLAERHVQKVIGAGR